MSCILSGVVEVRMTRGRAVHDFGCQRRCIVSRQSVSRDSRRGADDWDEDQEDGDERGLQELGSHVDDGVSVGRHRQTRCQSEGEKKEIKWQKTVAETRRGIVSSQDDVGIRNERTDGCEA